MSQLLQDQLGTIDLSETVEPPTDIDVDHTPGDAGQDFGRCPICQKPLRPHDPETGQPRTPPVGKGFSSRAKCLGCGSILYYKGGKDWGLLLDSDLSDMDRALSSLGGL
jgi:uncharacterized protein with PIN domain